MRNIEKIVVHVAEEFRAGGSVFKTAENCAEFPEVVQ